MTSRSLSVIAFVALCLVLSALVLHRQIAAHPASPEIPQETEQADKPIPNFPGRAVDQRTWHIANGVGRSLVIASIQDQLNGLRGGDAQEAVKYQSRRLRRNFSSPEAFLQMIQTHYPEFGHCRAARYGPVWADPTGQYADVIVTVRGENDLLARGDYLMVREDGLYRVAGVSGGGRIPE